MRFVLIRLERDEAVQEAVCLACETFARLVEQGRSEAANPSSLVRFAVAQVPGAVGRLEHR